VPFHRGELVSFRPPGWAGHGRQGQSRFRPGARCSSSRAWGPGGRRSGT
jgi:hypothetical protein